MNEVSYIRYRLVQLTYNALSARYKMAKARAARVYDPHIIIENVSDLYIMHVVDWCSTKNEICMLVVLIKLKLIGELTKVSLYK